MLRQMGLFMALGSALLAGQQSERPVLHSQRAAASDLEVTGVFHGVAPTASRFISRETLLKLPQVEASIRLNQELSDKSGAELAVRGIYLSDLAQILGAQGDAIVAICTDGYTSTFPVDYIKQHRPILVLTVQDLTPHDWAIKNRRFDPSPYFVGYQNFIPAFKVFSHADRPAEPDGMTKLVFDNEQQLFRKIVPADPADTDGYRIARQNCYRCHNAGANGGTKAGMSWTEVGRVAKTKPGYFAAWVHDPKSIQPGAKMPSNLDYDSATLAALQRYFATFAAEGE